LWPPYREAAGEEKLVRKGEKSRGNALKRSGVLVRNSSPQLAWPKGAKGKMGGGDQGGAVWKC